MNNRNWYDVAQVCLNGHLITSKCKEYPEDMKDFCNTCGEMTIIQCPSCNTNIQGYYHIEGIINFSFDDEVVSYCHACGKPYPWTERKLNSLRQLIDLTTTDEQEKDVLKGELNDLTSDNPKTKLAATRMKIFINKAGKEVGSALRDILVDIASETAKKIIND